jgi:ubiquinone/menaquinone biosynthesis C-methylase UbiE
MTRAARNDNEVQRFDRRASAYERGWRAEFHARVVARSADAALRTVVDPTAVLDVGCGTGALVRELARRLPAGVELAGVDPAPAMIEVGQGALRECPNAHLEVASAEQLPFSAVRFDLVISTVSFHHWADQAAGLSEISRVLRPSGRLLLADNFATGWLRVFNAIAHRNMRTQRDVERLLAGARLTPLDWVRIYDVGPLPLIQAVIAGHSAR